MQREGSRHLLIVLDGLRPDYVTPELMPNLHALGRRGVVFANHHAVFPTVTRVNAASIVTGAYPGRHGLMGNSVFFPEVDPRRFLDTADYQNLTRIDRATDGELLTAPTLSEILRASDRKVLAVGSGSTGAAYLLNHKVSGGAILHTSFAIPESLHREALSRFGETPPAGMPNDARNRRAVDLFLELGLKRIDPAVTLMWISDPDTTAHEHGVGHAVTSEAIRRVDGEIKRLEDGLRQAGMLDSHNIWVTSDHGFSTYTAGPNVAGLLEPFTGVLADGTPRVITAGGAVYVRDRDRATVTAIVKQLQRTAGIGAVFTPAAEPGGLRGRESGTISHEAIAWNHARAADILFSPDWTDQRNVHGYVGTTASGGVAGHGSSSPHDVHNVLVAAGPDLKQGTVVNAPTGNVDFAPTLLRLLGVDVPPSMEGRAMDEALRTGPDASTLNVQPAEVTVANADGSYTLTAFFSAVSTGGRHYRYLDYTRVDRR
jgi:predicted AlkP superfamily pyrophosphatase or phosphodiesterase